MMKQEERKFYQRYNRFRKNNLPTPFWDKERKTLEYVYYNESYEMIGVSKNTSFDYHFEVIPSLSMALGQISHAGFYFPFHSKYFSLSKDLGKVEHVLSFGHLHVHTFEEVVNYLYCFPESFQIIPDEEEFYSTQELCYLKQVQKYLLFLGLKDLESDRISVERYRNKRQKKYGVLYHYSLNEAKLNLILSGKQDFMIWRIDGELPEEKQYAKNQYRALIRDADYNIRAYIEFTHTKIMRFSDTSLILETYLPDEMVELRYFKILEKF